MTGCRKFTRLTLVLAILCSFIGCDQATKRYATDNLQYAETQTYFGGTVRLDYALNSGGFLSMGSQLFPITRSFLFIGLNICLMAALVLYLIHNWNSRLAIFVSLSYILAGGIGNLIDRISNNGLVIDFINVGCGQIRTGIFNVADMGVMFGAAVLMFCLSNEPDLRHKQSDENPG